MANKKPKSTSNTGKKPHSRHEMRYEMRQNRPRNTHTRRRATSRRTPWLLGGAVVLIAAIVVFFIYLSTQSSTKGNNIAGGNFVDATTLKEVTNVDAGFLSTIGTGGVADPFSKAQGSLPVLTGPTDKPQVFYYGADWCPNCAAERWSIVVAMSRFGTFKSLRETASASDDSYPNTATFTFSQSTYTSAYIDFVPLENQDQQRNVIQTPTADQQQILTRYNVGGYPFMDIGDRYLIKSASYDPGVLRSSPQDPTSTPLSLQDIATQLSSGNQLSKDILGVANYITAATCTITTNQPATVCSDATIQKIGAVISSAKQSSIHAHNSLPLAVLGQGDVEAVERRWNLS